MSRSKLARTRLTDDEYALYEEGARRAGLVPAEYLRQLIVQGRSLPARVESVEMRLKHVEEQLAEQWRTQGARQNEEVS